MTEDNDWEDDDVHLKWAPTNAFGEIGFANTTKKIAKALKPYY